MAAREKFIVITAILAVIIFSINYFTGSSEKKTFFIKNNSENTSGDEYIIIEKIKNDLSNFKISKAELFIINQINSDWKDNFIIPNENRDEDEDKDPKPKYSGYLSMGNIIFAILDGNEYQVGEKLESSSNIIEKITPENVVIRKKNGNEIFIPIEDFD